MTPRPATDKQYAKSCKQTPTISPSMKTPQCDKLESLRKALHQERTHAYWDCLALAKRLETQTLQQDREIKRLSSLIRRINRLADPDKPEPARRRPTP